MQNVHMQNVTVVSKKNFDVSKDTVHVMSEQFGIPYDVVILA